MTDSENATHSTLLKRWKNDNNCVVYSFRFCLPFESLNKSPAPCRGYFYVHFYTPHAGHLFAVFRAFSHLAVKLHYQIEKRAKKCKFSHETQYKKIITPNGKAVQSPAIPKKNGIGKRSFTYICKKWSKFESDIYLLYIGDCQNYNYMQILVKNKMRKCRKRVKKIVRFLAVHIKKRSVLSIFRTVDEKNGNFSKQSTVHFAFSVRFI